MEEIENKETEMNSKEEEKDPLSALPVSIRSIEDLKKIIKYYDKDVYESLEEQMSDFFSKLKRSGLVSKQSIAFELEHWNTQDISQQTSFRTTKENELKIPKSILNLLFQWSTPEEQKEQVPQESKKQKQEVVIWYQILNKPKTRIIVPSESTLGELKTKIRNENTNIFSNVDASSVVFDGETDASMKIEEFIKIKSKDDSINVGEPTIMVKFSTESLRTKMNLANSKNFDTLSETEIFEEFKSIFNSLDHEITLSLKNINGIDQKNHDNCCILKPGIKISRFTELNKNYDLSLATLPDDFPSQIRANKVSTILREKHVIAIGVSGVGKSQLAFDICKKKYGFYFDLNGGGNAKVPQSDMDNFVSQIKAALNEKSFLVVEWLSQVLITSRFLILLYLKKLHNITSEQWLLIQIYFNSIFRKIFEYCLNYSSTSIVKLLTKLKEMLPDSPIIFLDEAQGLMSPTYQFTDGTVSKPILSKILSSIQTLQFKTFISGTHLNLIDVPVLYSSLGGQTNIEKYLEFDYLVSKSQNKKDSVPDLLNYFLDFDFVNKEVQELIFYFLQGRPRFTSQFIQRLILKWADMDGNKLFKDDVTNLDVSEKTKITSQIFLETLNSYSDQMMKSLDPSSLYHWWNKLYSCRTTEYLDGSTLFQKAIKFLLNSIVDETFTETPKQEFVSWCITLFKQQPDGTIHQFLKEPLCKNAGIYFCLEKRYPILKEYLDIIKNANLSQSTKGHAYEFVVALNIYFLTNQNIVPPDVKDLFKNDLTWKNTFNDTKFPKFKGILVDAPISILSNRKEWIIIPEENAGPDIIALPLSISLKTTTKDCVDEESCKIGIRTTDPYKFYFTKDGFQTNIKILESLQVLSEISDKPLGRIRIDIPESHQKYEQSPSNNNYWNIPYFKTWTKYFNPTIELNELYALIDSFYANIKNTSFYYYLQKLLDNYDYQKLITVNENHILFSLAKDPTLNQSLIESFQKFSNPPSSTKKEDSSSTEKEDSSKLTSPLTLKQSLIDSFQKCSRLTYNPPSTGKKEVEDFPQFLFIQTLEILFQNIISRNDVAQLRSDHTDSWLQQIDFKWIKSAVVTLGKDNNNPLLKDIF